MSILGGLVLESAVVGLSAGFDVELNTLVVAEASRNDGGGLRFRHVDV